MADELDFPAPPPPAVLMRIATISAANGALAGGLEGLGLAWGTRAVIGPGGAFLLVVVNVLLDALLGLGAGLFAGLLAALLDRSAMRWKRLRNGSTFATFLLVAFFLAPLARELWVVQERRGPAMGMVALSAMIVATFWYNASYWLRRDEAGSGPVFGWRVYAPLSGLALSVFAALSGGHPPRPEIIAPAGQPNLILVTIDTLRRDHVGAFGSLVQTPNLDRLAREGARFDDAITPVPETAPSHSAMLSGLHPVQSGVIANGIPLRGGVFTITEELEAFGYRTGAFVSSFAAGSTTGLDQGFQVFDDDFTPGVRGVGRTRLLRLALPLLLRFGDPAHVPWLLERRAPATIEHALAWVNEKSDAPLFLWVHLFEPHSPYERPDCVNGGPDCTGIVDHRAILAKEPGYSYTEAEETALRRQYRAEVEYTDTQIGVLMDGLRNAGVLDGALVVVSGDHGESLGEHGIKFNHHGLYDDVLRVPMIVWTPKPDWTPGAVAASQVTVLDIANTFLEWAHLPLLSKTTSQPLLREVRGDAPRNGPVMLLGRLEVSRTAGQLYGARDPKGVKYILNGTTDEVYDLGVDPGELVNIAADQPNAVAAGRSTTDLIRRQLGQAPEAQTSEMLKALGYQE
jgi:arylsulfatase A-like enzyme